MAIFSRRVLQRMLDQNADALPESTTRAHVDALNRLDARSLDIEWEVAVLYGLAKLGVVRHELSIASGRRPDVQFKSEFGEFVGDITSVSDAGVAARNPWEVFNREFLRRARKAGLSGSGFDVAVGSRTEGVNRSRKFVLALPGPGQMKQFFEGELEEFFASVKSESGCQHRIRLQTTEVDVAIAYDPCREYLTASLATFDAPQSPTHNPLYSALKGKADQLRAVGATSVTVVFACDGGSMSLRSRSRQTGGPTTDQIVARFFRDHAALTCVCILTIERRPRMPLEQLQPAFLKVATYFHPMAERTVREQLRSLCARLAREIPAPESEAVSARYYLEHPGRKRGRSYWGGFTVTGDSIRLSARAVLGLLAGNITSEQFMKAHGFVESAGRKGWNPLRALVRRGMLIESVELEKTESADDDWLVFRLGGPDAAVAPFRVKTVGGSKQR